MKIAKNTIWYGLKTFLILKPFEYQGITKNVNNLFTCDREDYNLYFDFLGEEYFAKPKHEKKMVEKPKTIKMVEKKTNKRRIFK
jgi:hypothetical protein